MTGRSQRHLFERDGYDSNMRRKPTPPTNVTLTPAVIGIADANGTVVGVLAATGDLDVDESFTYALTVNPGTLFDISGANLRKAAAITAGAKNITVRATDRFGLTFDKALVVTAGARPTDITLSTPTIADDAAVDDVVGALSTTDATDGDTFTYALLDDADGKYALDVDEIIVADALEEGTDEIQVRVTDSIGLTFTKTLEIEVTAA